MKLFWSQLTRKEDQLSKKQTTVIVIDHLCRIRLLNVHKKTLLRSKNYRGAFIKTFNLEHQSLLFETELTSSIENERTKFQKHIRIDD